MKDNFLGVGLMFLEICFEKCVCWRRLHNELETKCIKSGGKSQFSLSFFSSTVNDVRRKLYMVGIYSTVEN